MDYTDDVVCPRCGYEMASLEHDAGDEIGELYCLLCGFGARVSLKTRKIKEVILEPPLQMIKISKILQGILSTLEEADNFWDFIYNFTWLDSVYDKKKLNVNREVKTALLGLSTEGHILKAE